MEKTEYEVQLFGFSAAQVTLERQHLFKTLLVDALDSMIKKTTNNEETAKLLSEQKLPVLQNILESLSDNFKAFETLDRKYFNIPSHVLLESDFEHSKEHTYEMEKELDEQIASLEKLYLENAVMKESLKMEEERFDAIKPYIVSGQETQEQLRKCLEEFDFREQLTYIQSTQRFLNALSGKR